MNADLSTLRRSASGLLAYSLIATDPSLLLVEGGELMVGFYYDFIPSYEVSEPFLHLVEERMRQIVRESHPIEMGEMESKNAKEYLRHLGHHFFSEGANETGKATTTLFRIGDASIRDSGIGDSAIFDFADPLAPPFIKNTKEICHFRLHSLQKIGKNRFRIFGSVDFNDQEMKLECKLFAQYQKKNHLIDGEKEDLFHREEKGFFWHPKGVYLKEKCIEYWKEEIEKQNFHCIETPVCGKAACGQPPCSKKEEKISMHLTFFEKKGKNLPFRTAELFLEENTLEKEILIEGLLNLPCSLRTLELSFVSQKELLNECISCLQFIDKILNMFKFSKPIEWVFSSCKRAKMFAEEEILTKALEKLQLPFLREERRGKRVAIEARIKDRLGRKWAGPYLSIGFGNEDVSMIERSSLGLLERWMALLMEQSPEVVSQFLKGKYGVKSLD